MLRNIILTFRTFSLSQCLRLLLHSFFWLVVLFIEALPETFWAGRIYILNVIIFVSFVHKTQNHESISTQSSLFYSKNVAISLSLFCVKRGKNTKISIIDVEVWHFFLDLHFLFFSLLLFNPSLNHHELISLIDPHILRIRQASLRLAR